MALQKQATKRTLCKFVKLEGGEEPSQEARQPLQLNSSWDPCHAGCTAESYLQQQLQGKVSQKCG